MQVAARLLRSRLSPSIVSACGASHVSCPILRVPVLGNHVVGSSEPCLHRVFSSTNFYRHAHWGPLKQLQPTIRALGRRQHTETIVGLTIATSYLSRSQGFSKAILCERDQQARVTSYSPKENFLDLEERQDSLVQWLKRLWVPALVVMTVAMGYQYPVSLFVNLIFLLWSTKPTPASIYIWVEQRRLRQASERRSFDRLKEKSGESAGIKEHLSSVFSNATLSSLWAWQLNPTATVMHVEVRDYMFFCLARVTSITQNCTMVGLLGDWWVIYSSSSTITALGLSSLLPTRPPVLTKQL